MANEIQKFDVTEHIRSRVREVIVASLPDEHLDVMIWAEYDRFFSTRDQWNRDRIAPFAEVVRSELETHIKDRIRRWLAAHFEAIWKDGEQELVGKMVTELVPVVQEGMITRIVSEALGVLQRQLVR